MNRLASIFAIAAIWGALTSAASAQSTATPVVPGYLTTSGCPYGQTSCFVQYGSTGPAGGTVTANQGTPNAGGVNSWFTQGPETAAAALIGGGFRMMGSDGTNARDLSTDTSGRLILGAGSQLVGKVGIDQTTPGTTNGVSATNLPTTADTNFGTPGASTLRMVNAPACTSVIPISVSTSTDLKTLTNKAYICAVILVSASSETVSLVEGTGTVCATGIAALIGGTTVSIQLAPNSGFSAIGGVPWLVTQTAADHLCLLLSGATNVSGVITYRDAP